MFPYLYAIGSDSTFFHTGLILIQSSGFHDMDLHLTWVSKISISCIYFKKYVPRAVGKGWVCKRIENGK